MRFCFSAEVLNSESLKSFMEEIMDTITKSFADVAGLSSIYFVSHLGVNCIDFMVFFFFFFFFFWRGVGRSIFTMRNMCGFLFAFLDDEAQPK